jgi:hypothetical protein
MAVAGVQYPTVNRHHHYLLLTMFRWLLPVFTTRQSTAITTHFPGFRRISIDDMRKTQVMLTLTRIKITVLRIRTHRIRMFLGILDPHQDPLVRGTDLNPDPSIIKQR